MSSAPEFSDEALALDTVRDYGADWRYVADTNEWLNFNSAIWLKDKRRGIFTLAREICRRNAAIAAADKSPEMAMALASAKKRAAVVDLMRDDPRITVSYDQLNSNPMLLGTPAGYVDLETGKIFDADRKYLITQSTAVAPASAGTDCPKWREYLKTTFPLFPGSDKADDETIDLIQCYSGYTLTGLTSPSGLFFYKVPGATAKTS